MGNICLWLTENLGSSETKLWLSSVPDKKLLIHSPTDVTADIIKHAEILLVEENLLDTNLKIRLEARVQHSFATTLVLGASSATPYETELASRSFTLNNRNLTAWLTRTEQHLKQPVYSVDELVSSWRNELLSHLKTDHFQTDLAPLINSENWASQQAKDKESMLEYLEQTEDAASLPLAEKLDLFVSLRAFGCFEQIIDSYHSFHPVEQALDLFVEQYVFAANRLANEVTRKVALVDLLENINKPSTETWALKGRIYKDCWQLSLAHEDIAQTHLEATINAYRQGSHLDIRDAYPAINLATLLRIRGRSQDLFEMRKVLNNIEYNLFVSTNALDLVNGMQFNMSGRREADYWDMATVFEMSIINHRFDDAMALINVLIDKHTEHWMLLTTLNNISLMMKHCEPAFQQFLAPIFFTFKGKVEQL
ncbi:TRAFs-binding domain-containing protein [Psychromonas aquimarina]|uniref:TRAFs-binding domain-containing protein n=1 Tax=Psychromonas aquimarina TaxID=444919 RepID=UPI0004010180|nr:TRAFs-binding domain-containing protein [Psychromonas aquimarina]